MLAACSTCFGQATVEMRIVEMSGRTKWYPFNGSSVLNYSIQARVLGGSPAIGLGDWGFSLRLAGELEGQGALTRLRINNPDGSVYTDPPTTSFLGGAAVGVAVQYRYLVGLSSTFNGVINLSWGAYTNGPDQEILGIVGSVRGAGLEPGGIITCVPDPLDPMNNVVCSITPQPQFQQAMEARFGANANWVELYRFRYTMSNLTPRTFTPTLVNPFAATFESLVPAGADFSANTAGGTALVSLVDIQPFQVGPDDVFVLPASQEVGVARVASLSIPSTDVPSSTTFQWRRNGVPISDEPGRVIGTNNRDLVIASARISDAGTYDCVIGPAFVTRPATLTVYCLSDFNRNGSTEVADVFDFLNSWFAGCSDQPVDPCNGRSLDIDNSGSTNVADIFAFLNLWFGRAAGQC